MSEDPFAHLNVQQGRGGLTPVFDHVAILVLLAEGKEQYEMARELDCKAASLQHRLRQMRYEWRVRNSTALVAQAYHRGVLQVPKKFELRLAADDAAS